MLYNSNLMGAITRTTGLANGWVPGKEFGFIAPIEGGAGVFVTHILVMESGFMPRDFTFGVEVEFTYTTTANNRRRMAQIYAIAGTTAESAPFIFGGKVRPGVMKNTIDRNKRTNEVLVKLCLGQRVRYAVEWNGKLRLLPPMSLVMARAEIDRFVEPPRVTPGQKTNTGGEGHVKGPSPSADNGKGQKKGRKNA